jgi:L-lactate dehydrogenase (cytochrome)
MNHDEKRAGGLNGQEIAKHNNRESCWVIIHNKAYDVTECMSMA